MRNYSPWPEAGRRYRFDYLPMIAALAHPDYNAGGARYTLLDLKRLDVREGRRPFFSIRNRFFHFYVGWKPINVADDPAFFWRELKVVQDGIKRNVLFGELSIRFGVGSIS
jgi:hypothetical protein